MPDITSNILITTNDNTANLATDYGTSGTGFTAAHVSITKLAYGDTSTSTRVSTASPLPIYIYGATGTTLPISGTLGGTGTYFVRNTASTYLQIAGTTFSSTAVGITGTVQGYVGMYPIDISGSEVDISTASLVRIQGHTSGIPVGITGGRYLGSGTDSISVIGSVSLSGLTLNASTHSVAVYGADLSDKIQTRIYASDGVSLGHSGDALNVHIVNTGVTFSLNISATVGVTNGTDSLGLMVRGTGNTAAYPIIIQGTSPGGAMEIVSYVDLPVSFGGTMAINDSGIINSLESSTKPLITKLTSLVTNTTNITAINDKLNTGTIQSKISEITRSNSVSSGRKEATTAASVLSTAAITLKGGINIKASTRNTDFVYVGSSRLVSLPNDGYPLEPGESIFIECNSAGLIYVKANSGTQTIHYIAS